ncbi:uncharacterized protein NPIL_28681 [Nephila pilipes]|uniref:Uncharacterized protein n=1 Tax=Nephila pilipes TaxID=299642 RepID=A0A8X6P2C5_NEPPI|nr:uncharacterized protein NPIL_28681 [Nephila pilipes]
MKRLTLKSRKRTKNGSQIALQFTDFCLLSIGQQQQQQQQKEARINRTKPGLAIEICPTVAWCGSLERKVSAQLSSSSLDRISKFRETTTTVINNGTTPAPIIFTDPLYNKYAIIGALLVMTGLFLAAVVYYFLQGSDSCCRNENASHMYSVVSDDADSFTDSEEDFRDLYTSCQLCVHDHEINTASIDFEYDCRSIEDSLLVDERTVLLNENRRRSEVFRCPEPCAIHGLP